MRVNSTTPTAIIGTITMTTKKSLRRLRKLIGSAREYRRDGRIRPPGERGAGYTGWSAGL
jgi:hypothetical protein